MATEAPAHGGYLDILRAPHAARLLAGTLVGRLPNGVGPIALTLFVRDQGGSYTLAGGLIAAYGVATAIGQPLLGRAVDLKGQPRVQLPAAVLSALGMTLLALAGIGHLALAYAAVVLAASSPRPWRAGCGPCGRASSAARTGSTARTPWTRSRRRSCSPSAPCC